MKQKTTTASYIATSILFSSKFFLKNPAQQNCTAAPPPSVRLRREGEMLTGVSSYIIERRTSRAVPIGRNERRGKDRNLYLFVKIYIVLAGDPPER